MNLVEKAQQFATKKHAGQFRKDGKTPYITHPHAVVELLKKIGVADENIIAAGWLHDTIEDCGVTKDDLAREFNAEVARIVSALTRDVSRDEYKERMLKADYAVQIVKLADVVHNCSTLTPDLTQAIENKVKDSKVLYLPLAKKICPEFYEMLSKNKYIKKALEK